MRLVPRVPAAVASVACSLPDPPMFRFLPGLLLIQIVTLVLFAFSGNASPQDLAVRVGLPALLITIVTALWFSNLSRIEAERRRADLKDEHARERERIRLDAMRDREQLQSDAVRDRESALERVRRESQRSERRAGRRANLTVGLAYAAVTAIGVLMLMTNLLTLGLLTISTSAGALGGYLFRWRQTRQATLAAADAALVLDRGPGTARVIEALPGGSTRVHDGNEALIDASEASGTAASKRPEDVLAG